MIVIMKMNRKQETANERNNIMFKNVLINIYIMKFYILSGGR